MNDDLSNLNLVELIDRLQPVPEPAVVSLWLQTMGWIWLGLAVTGLTAFGVHRFVCWRRANAYRRAALQELAAVGSDPAAIALILRRSALSAYPRTRVASLHGDDWLAFLDRTYGGKGFQDGPGRTLATAPYVSEANAHGLATLAAIWIRRHRAAP